MHEVPQFVPQKVCLSCDGCCRFKDHNSSWRPKVSKEEVGPKIAPQDLDDEGRVKTVSCGGKIQCKFFHVVDNTCGIYTQRPFECALYPFLLMKEAGGVALGVHLSCPHIQEKWPGEEFENHVNKLKEYFHRPEILSFIQNNPSLLGDYTNYAEEVERLFAI